MTSWLHLPWMSLNVPICQCLLYRTRVFGAIQFNSMLSCADWIDFRGFPKSTFPQNTLRCFQGIVPIVFNTACLIQTSLSFPNFLDNFTHPPGGEVQVTANRHCYLAELGEIHYQCTKAGIYNPRVKCGGLILFSTSGASMTFLSSGLECDSFPTSSLRWGGRKLANQRIKQLQQFQIGRAQVKNRQKT